METPVSRLPFWLHALMAEAKRRARRRRLLILLLVLVVAGATAAVVLRPSGGGSRSGGPSGRIVGGAAASSHSVHVGAFVLTVPKGFLQYELPPPNHEVWIANNHLKAAVTGASFPAREVYISVQQAAGMPALQAARFPLDLHQLHPGLVRAKFGTGWIGGFSAPGSGNALEVIVFQGRKASAADRAAIERVLRSIRRAS